MATTQFIFDTGPNVDSTFGYDDDGSIAIESLQVGDENPTMLQFSPGYAGFAVNVEVLELSPGSTLHLNGSHVSYDKLILGEGARILDADCDNDGWVRGVDLRCMNRNTIDYTLQRLGVIVGDFNADGEVGFADFTILSSNYGNATDDYMHGDANVDGQVGFADLLILAGKYGDKSGQDLTWDLVSVPEPDYSILVLLVVAFSWRRQRAI